MFCPMGSDEARFDERTSPSGPISRTIPAVDWGELDCLLDASLRPFPASGADSVLPWDCPLRGPDSLPLASPIPPQPDPVSIAPPVEAPDRRLDALLRFSGGLASVSDEEQLERLIRECLFSATPAVRLAILFSHPPADYVAPIHTAKEGRGPSVVLDRSAIQELFARKESVMRNGIAENGRIISRMVIGINLEPERPGALFLESDGADGFFQAADRDIAEAVARMSAAAWDYALRREWIGLRANRGTAAASHNMIGNSPAMLEVYSFISRAAPKDSTVLITGESGSGKELVAQAIHANSDRASKPFVAINCAALTDTLLESELFGHERGAFTGAFAQKRGKLEAAEGGTVFLDEVGEMSSSLQAKVLRVLQEREFERVGGAKTHKLDIRLIAATNRDLRGETQTGGFRADLFFRLNVVSIAMPPLRQRREDIPALAAFFAERYGLKMGRPIAGVSREARALLMAYHWPGNVRELENAIEQAVVLGASEIIQAEELPAILREKPVVSAGADTLAAGLRDAKRQIVLRALEQTGGNQSDAAEILGVHANHLSRLIKTLALRPPRKRRKSG